MSENTENKRKVYAGQEMSESFQFCFRNESRNSKYLSKVFSLIITILYNTSSQHNFINLSEKTYRFKIFLFLKIQYKRLQ